MPLETPSRINSRNFAQWRPGVIAAAVVILITAIPQVSLIIKRGAAWQGSYALIEGRPHRNNPYLGKDSDLRQTGESYFSIQFIPSFAIALPARALGISASTAFILIAPLMAFASALAIFWLLVQITRNEVTAAVGVLVVLLCGRLISESPFSAEQVYSSFAFLRRYLPAVPVPFFFLFCGFVLRAFVTKSKMCALAAGAVLAILIYSYFYLWSAAAAWLFCLAVLWLVARRDEWRSITGCVLAVAVIALCALVPYLHLLTLRDRSLDADQALTFSHAPDLFRVSEIISLLIIVTLVVYAWRRRVEWRSPEVLFVSACATTPFVVFNQQVVTGLSLQAFHYEQFIINYVVLLSVVATYHLIWSRLKIRPILWAVFAAGVGLVTALKEADDNSGLNVRRDQARPVFKRLEISDPHGIVLFNNSLLAASAQSDSSVGQLWAPNMYIYGGVSDAERVERFYQYLYLLGVDPRTFEKDLQNSPQFRAAVFGLRRANAVLSQRFTPVSAQEIRAEAGEYLLFRQNFSQQQANRWPLAYVVMLDDAEYDFTDLDRWYSRSEGEKVGNCVIYHVQLKQ